jgi:hypothetical protein
MKKFFTTLVLALFCASFCPMVYSAKKVIKENRETGTFRKISMKGIVNVYFTQTDSYSLVVEANDDLISKLSTTVDGETLVIKWTESIRRTGIFNQTVSNVYVSAPALDTVNADFGTDFYADKLKCEGSFKLRVSGGADADIINLTIAKNADISVSSGDINVKTLTVTGNTNISASRGSDCDIETLQTNKCNLSASSGDINVKTLIVIGNTNISASRGSNCDIEALQTNKCNLSASAATIDVSLTASDSLNINSSVGADIRVTGKAPDIKVSARGADVDIKKLSYSTIALHKSRSGNVRK